MSITILLLLYYIFNLHQTTTIFLSSLHPSLLYYIFNLHQTTTDIFRVVPSLQLYYIFNLHQTTTKQTRTFCSLKLYYIFNLHQTTTDKIFNEQQLCCIISLIYIKPQHHGIRSTLLLVVLYL